MKKIFNKIKLINPFRLSIFNSYYLKKVSNSFEIFLEYFLPENWRESSKSYTLFWLMCSFTIIFLIWASMAEINQVVKASGTVTPDSKVHMVQTAVSGPLEDIRISLGDTIKVGDILFLVNNVNNQLLHDLAKDEVDTRKKKVEIIEKLVEKGSDSEFRLLDEKLTLIDAQKRFEQAKTRLEFSYIRSPISGVVSKVNSTNIGQVIKEAATLAEIVPENNILQIEAGVSVKDIAYVRVGQKAKVSFSAFDMAIYGQVEGTVIKKAANSTQNEDGSSFYQLIIEVDSKSIAEEQNIIIQSGMQCDVSIIGQERTVLSYIANPITKLSMRALQE
jgi:membrane fusion protein, adhesin transport system